MPPETATSVPDANDYCSSVRKMLLAKVLQKNREVSLGFVAPICLRKLGFCKDRSSGHSEIIATIKSYGTTNSSCSAARALRAHPKREKKPWRTAKCAPGLSSKGLGLTPSSTLWPPGFK